MTAFDTIFVQVAIDLLDTFGISATLHKITKGTYDGFTDTKTTDYTVDTAVVAAPPFDAEFMRAQGIAAEEKGLMTILSSVDASGAALSAPALTDQMTISGEKYMIVKVQPIISGDSIAAHILTLKKT